MEKSSESKQKPLIGITASIFPSVFKWGAKIYGQNHRYSDAVIAAGGVPVLLPPMTDRESLRVIYERLDGILFSGGGDIDPVEYGEINRGLLKDVSPERDTGELQLIKWAIADDMPLLAICRGFQVFNVALGGTLYQDIPSELDGALNHDVSTQKGSNLFIAHDLIPKIDSRLAEIVGLDPIGANSHHHQGIKKLAPGLTATSQAADGIVESVELTRSRFAIGVQCHPEALFMTEPRWGGLFKEFVNASRDMPYTSPARSLKSAATEAAEVL
jgi:putative glutamine amidotransferase